MTPSPSSLGPQLRTLGHLQPSQVLHRLRLQAQRRRVQRDPHRYEERWTPAVPERVGLPDTFKAIDATVLANRWDFDDLASGTFTLLNDRRHLGSPVDWTPKSVTQLWSFHLHYWEWAWTLAAVGGERAKKVFADHFTSWSLTCTYGGWDAWAAYPASLRAWVLVNVHQALALGTEIEEQVGNEIARHAGFIEHNLELDVGGNHIIKNIKGLLGCAVFLGDRRLQGLALKHLNRELATQILADGGHYELSPSYHCQVLADLADMAELLTASGATPPPDLQQAVDSMRRWLGEMLLPDGSLPLLNDSEPVGADLIAQLHPAQTEEKPLTVLADSGYLVARNKRFHLIADVGQPGPASPPGHIHADCLSFTLHVDGIAAIVDTGTSEYGYGPRRDYERSTAAHNTLEIDHTNQTEVIGAFRAGRRARATLERAEVLADGTIVISGFHDGYRHLPGSPQHRRTWTIGPATVTLTDVVEGTGTHDLALRLHMSASDTEKADDALQISVARQDGPPDSCAIDISTISSLVAQGFGILTPAVSHQAHIRSQLPVTLTTQLEAR